MVLRVAGSDSYGGTGNGGPAIDALFQSVRAVKLDKQGNLFVAEIAGHRIRKINLTTGIVSAFAGNGLVGFSGDGGSALNAQINSPWDIALDRNGNLFVADYGNNRIRKIDVTTGAISTFAGTGVANSDGDGGLAVNAGVIAPTSVNFDGAGNLYFTENAPGSNRLRKVDAITGIITTIAGNNSRGHSGDGGLAANAGLIEPTGVVVDDFGNIYLSEYVGSRIRRINASTGIINTIAGTGIDGFSGDKGPYASAQLNEPVGLAFDNKGNLLVCDSYNYRIRKLHMNMPFPPDTGPNTGPIVTISSPTNTVCNGSVIKFTASPYYEVAGSKLVWTRNGQTVGTDSISWTASGLQPGDVIACELHFPVCIGTTKVLSNTITITGNSSLPLSVSVSANKISICKNDTVTFKARVVNGSNGLVYRWKVNNTDVGANDSVLVNSLLSDGDLVSCDVSVPSLPPCSSGASASSNKIAIRIRNATVPKVSISASGEKICAGESVTFKATVVNSDTTHIIRWSVNGLAAGSSGESFTARSLSNNDVVNSVLTSSDVCLAPVSSNNVKITVDDPPTVRVLPSDTVVGLGSTITLRATVTGASSYSWSPAFSLSGSNTLTPVTVPLQRTTLFMLKALSAGNCADSATVRVRVEQKLFMPNAFTPNNDARNDVYRIPPDTKIDLKDFSIFNAWGQKVFSTSEIDRGWDGTVKGVLQNSGTYIYVVVGSDVQGPVYKKGTFQLIR